LLRRRQRSHGFSPEFICFGSIAQDRLHRAQDGCD
jgi:hypothetical protein